jgi:hypothetical protein
MKTRISMAPFDHEDLRVMAEIEETGNLVADYFKYNSSINDGFFSRNFWFWAWLSTSGDRNKKRDFISFYFALKLASFNLIIIADLMYKAFWFNSTYTITAGQCAEPIEDNSNQNEKLQNELKDLINENRQNIETILDNGNGDESFPKNITITHKSHKIVAVCSLVTMLTMGGGVALFAHQTLAWQPLSVAVITFASTTILGLAAVYFTEKATRPNISITVDKLKPSFLSTSVEPGAEGEPGAAPWAR